QTRNVEDRFVVALGDANLVLGLVSLYDFFAGCSQGIAGHLARNSHESDIAGASVIDFVELRKKCGTVRASLVVYCATEDRLCILRTRNHNRLSNGAVCGRAQND